MSNEFPRQGISTNNKTRNDMTSAERSSSTWRRKQWTQRGWSTTTIADWRPSKAAAYRFVPFIFHFHFMFGFEILFATNNYRQGISTNNTNKM
ncbi:unnamed protein product [Anisakis simplex]|uniref:Uncharacterized protein n=1 Tax=Anisakis simplex TaxID=6269 RepID=A0A0M3KDH5_ANISI|nr:unnamed protein product [Anisakis simplex]